MLPLLPTFHPHSSVSFFSSVHYECSQFSRCCHLFCDLVSIYSIESWARPSTQSPERGAWALHDLNCSKRNCSLRPQPPLWSADYCATVRTLHHLPRGDVVAQLAPSAPRTAISRCRELERARGCAASKSSWDLRQSGRPSVACRERHSDL